MWFTAATLKSINRLLENERNLSFNKKNFDQILRGIFGPATFCFTAVLPAAKAVSMLLSTSYLSDSNKISKNILLVIHFTKIY